MKLYATHTLRSSTSILLLAGSLCLPGAARATGATPAPYATKVNLGHGVEVSLYTPTMFRFRVSHLKQGEDRATYEIPFLMARTAPWPGVPFHLHQEKHLDLIETASLQIRVSRVDHTFTVWTTHGHAQIYPSSGPTYGMFRDGYTVFDAASAFNQPSFYSRYEHWFYDSDTGRYADTYLAEDLIYDRFFIYGPGYERLYEQLKDLAGPEPLLRRKAYGFFQTQHLGCKGSQSELIEVARKFRERHIPADTLIVDYEWGDGCPGGDEDDGNWGRLDWAEPYRRPLSPREMIAELHRMHYDVMLIQHSAPDFPHRAEAVKRERSREWTSKVYDERFWWSKVREKLDLGVDGIWQDTRKNDITDSVIWKGLQDYYGTSRRVLFMGNRNMVEMDPWSPERDDSYPGNSLLGSRRYPFRWTGDAHTTWSELQWHINAITNTFGPMAGVDYITADGYAADWKQQARWNQFLDFVTVARSHTMKPWDRGLAIEELASTMAFGERREEVTASAKEAARLSSRTESSNGPPSAEDSIRQNLRLRYRLLPYLYSEAFAQYQTGFPILRPMVLAFPDDPYCKFDRQRYQYMFGDGFLVAPVWADLDSMEIYLPKGGDWIDYWGKHRYQGGKIVVYDARDTAKLPLFVKAGSIIPMRRDAEWIDPDQPDDPLTLDIYPARTPTSFTLYEDDGVTTLYQSGEFTTTTLENQPEPNGNTTFTVGGTRGNYRGKPQSRTWLLDFNLEANAPRSVLLNGERLPQAATAETVSSGTGWSYDADQKMLKVRAAKKAGEELTVTIVRNAH